MPSPLPESPPRPWRPDVGRGVFETILVLDGRPVELEAHIARLRASLAALYPDRDLPDLDVPGLRHPYGPLSPGTSTAGDREALRIAVAPQAGGALGARIERRGATHGGIVSLHGGRVPGGLGPHKWADRSLFDAVQADLPADAIPLIVDTDGAVLEASRANVFAVSDGTLRTPPLDGRILPGITRARVLNLAAEREIATHESPLLRDDLTAADEVFLTGSVRGIEPVRALDGVSLAPLGPVASALAAELRQGWLDTAVG